MNKRIGITIGKFMPLHKGHELLIDVGADVFDELYVLVSGNHTDEIPINLRWSGVQEYVADNFYDNVNVVLHIDESPKPKEIDKHGTVLDKEFQDYWVNQFRFYCNLDLHKEDDVYFVSSDMYGKTMADLLGIKWFPIDPHRENFKISGTEIRKEPWKHFHLISDTMKHHYRKTIVFVGAESTGKSTFTDLFAEKYNGSYVHEYGRTLSELKNNELDEQDFHDIWRVQREMIHKAKNETQSGFTFVDTEAFTTYLFGEIYLDKKFIELKTAAKLYTFDLYVLLAPTVEWVDDGTRVIPYQAEREKFHNRLLQFLKDNNKPYLLVDEKSFKARYDTVDSWLKLM